MLELGSVGEASPESQLAINLYNTSLRFPFAYLANKRRKVAITATPKAAPFYNAITTSRGISAFCE
jgi:hypothetical protein